VPEHQPVLEARRREQQPGHELAGRGRVDAELAAGHAACAVHREGERAAAVVDDLDPESAQRLDRRAHRSAPGPLVAVEGDRAQGERGDGRAEAHQRAGEAAVDRHTADERRGSDEEVGAVAAVPPGRLDRGAERAQRVDHQGRVAGLQRREQQRGLVGEGGQHELAVREALGAGQGDRRGERRARPRGTPGGVAGGAAIACVVVIARELEAGRGISEDPHRFPQ
jgi:hypothetical protein